MIPIRIYRLLPILLALTCTAGLQAQAPPAYRSLPPADTSLPTIGARTNAGFGDYNEAYYVLDTLNAGLPAPPDTFYTLTPQETLESFVRACQAGRFATAAQALNLNLLPPGRQAERGELYAQQLYYVLDQRLGFDYGELPDRPDGAIAQPGAGGGPPAPRRSVEIGSLTANGRAVELRMQRVRVGDEVPRWLWTATTVEIVPALYRNYGPGVLESIVPASAKTTVFGVQAWILVGVVVFAMLAALLGWAIARGFGWFCRKVSYDWATELGDQLATPLGWALGILAFYFALNEALALSGPFARGLYTVLLVVVVFTLIWVASRGVDYTIGYLAERRLADISDEANDEARRRMTSLSVGRRAAVFVLSCVGVGIVLSRIQGLEALSYALLSSAGFAAVVLGIAAQSTLGNLVAGVQIALTRPVRIGDAVLYEGNWGNLEDVRFTYLVIRTWDLRRVIVPLKYFIDHPFENWSITDSKLLKPFYLYADYRIDVDAVRAKFDELVRGHELYNGDSPPDLIVYAAEDDAIKLRGTVSAENSGNAWTLHCDVREAMVRYIAELEDGLVLPRRRVRVVET